MLLWVLDGGRLFVQTSLSFDASSFPGRCLLIVSESAHGKAITARLRLFAVLHVVIPENFYLWSSGWYFPSIQFADKTGTLEIQSSRQSTACTPAASVLRAVS